MAGTVAVLATLALAAGCASATTGAAPVDGAAVYAARCALCHPPWDPRDYSPAEWPGLVRKFAPRAGLTAEEREAVTAFLVGEAARP